MRRPERETERAPGRHNEEFVYYIASSLTEILVKKETKDGVK